MKNRITSAVAVYLILENEWGQILINLRHNTGYQDGFWQVPAGHVETGELPIEALIRESREEVGIEIDPKDVVHVHTSSRPKHDTTGNRIDLYFKVKKWSGTPKVAEKDKCKEIRWCPVYRLPVDMTPHVKKTIQWAYGGSIYSEFSLTWILSQPEYGFCHAAAK